MADMVYLNSLVLQHYKFNSDYEFKEDIILKFFAQLLTPSLLNIPKN